jgi:hypothetical protein
MYVSRVNTSEDRQEKLVLHSWCPGQEGQKESRRTSIIYVAFD